MPAFKRVDQTLRSLEYVVSDVDASVCDLEVIVADSTPDDSLKNAILTKFSDRVVYLKPEKPGIASNKNAGAKAAKGDILIFCDSDMEIEKNSIMAAVNSLQNHPKAAAIGGTVLWRGGPFDGQKDRPRIEDRMLIRDDTTFIEALYSRFLATYKDVFWSVGGYDADVFNMRGEGSDLSIRYWRAGFPLAYDESIIVYHIHDVPDAAAVRVEHPEWGVAKDLLLLGYKYNMFNDGYKNFPATVDINFSPLGAEGYYRMLQGIGRHYDELIAAKQPLDVFRAKDQPAYDFKFLEVFSEVEMFNTCLDEVNVKLADIRAGVFQTQT